MRVQGRIAEFSSSGSYTTFLLHPDDGAPDLRVGTSKSVPEALKNGDVVELTGQATTDPPFDPDSITRVSVAPKKPLPWKWILAGCAAALALLILVLTLSRKPAAAPAAITPAPTPTPAPASLCPAGQVVRQARPTDNVCVSPEIAALVQQENQRAPTLWISGPYGPHTCFAGYVWREAYVGDDVCVSVDRRTASLQENGGRRVFTPGGLPFRSIEPNRVYERPAAPLQPR